MKNLETHVLVLKCPDARGVVAAVSGYLNDNQTSIVESSQFRDAEGDMFYMRVAFRPDGDRVPPMDVLKSGFAPIAHRFRMDWTFHDLARRPRLLIAVSKFGHCLYELMHRWRAGTLPADVVGVVSNHDDMRSFVEWNDVPYHHIPSVPGKKAEQEARLLALMETSGADVLVLARYMQILSDETCARLDGRCINIHHSFLPSFKGARPYHQAHHRGVKIIGATAHYVTPDLDEGPFIEQDVERVHHGHTPEQLVSLGQSIEARVLSRAVTWHCEHRVMMTGDKTVVFS
ncbi:MAG: formyltetrahydrofolate deformylase [Asticcacaulis sp.]